MNRLTIERPYKCLIRFLIITSTMVTIAGLLVLLLHCIPIETSMNFISDDPNCLPAHVINTFTIISSSYLIISDIIVAIIPIFLLWNIQLSPRLKFLTNIMLGLGLMLVVFPFFLPPMLYLDCAEEVKC
jgi:hypothetical protein